MGRLFGLLAAAGFALTLLGLIVSAAGYDVGSHFPGIWLLLPLSLIFFVPFVRGYRVTMGSKPTFRDIRAAFPEWVITFAALLAVNGWVGTWIGLSHMPLDGVPSKSGGRYQIVNHGRVLHPISETEYHRMEAANLQGIASLLLLFYFLPAAFFLFRNRET